MFETLKLGILGGGQLGSMLIRSAIDYGVEVSVMDKDPAAPGLKYTSNFHVADPLCYDSVIGFGKELNIITIEKEAVNTDALRELNKRGVKVFPSPDTIEIIQDKFRQKQFLASHQIPVAKGLLVKNRTELNEHLEKFPACLKKCRSGYDGAGVMILKGPEDVKLAFDEPSVLEELVNIKHEISVLVARNEHGEIKCYDPVMMMFNKERFILDFQFCPAGISHDLTLEAQSLAIRIAESLGLVGILAVEMFVTEQDELIINELAPRPHNSGHHTIEACTTSQYEQQLRAILAMPLGETGIHSSSVMLNIIGSAVGEKPKADEVFRSLLGMRNVHLHWYGKKDARKGRKIGHVTITDNNIEDALLKADLVRNILNN